MQHVYATCLCNMSMRLSMGHALCNMSMCMPVAVPYANMSMQHVYGPCAMQTCLCNMSMGHALCKHVYATCLWAMRYASMSMQHVYGPCAMQACLRNMSLAHICVNVCRRACPLRSAIADVGPLARRPTHRWCRRFFFRYLGGMPTANAEDPCRSEGT